MHEYEMGYVRDVPSLLHEMLTLREMGENIVLHGVYVVYLMFRLAALRFAI